MKNKGIYISGILLLIIFIIIFLPEKEVPKTSTINHDHSKKTIKKEELLQFEDYNACEVKNSITGNAKNGKYQKVFNKDIIQDVYINIEPNNLYYLFENAIDKPQVLINSIKIGEYSLSCSSMKTKGTTTLRSLWYTKFNKFSFTINFKKYLKNQNLFGLTKISFNNMYSDPSMVKEYISYYLFSEMGLDTPKYSYVNLYINNDYYGVYFMLEPIEKPLINRTMNENGDFLFKPEGEESSLVYKKELDKYLDKKGKYNFDKLVYNKKGEFIYPRSSNNTLNKYKGIWEDDEESFKKIYKQLPTFFKTLKKLNTLSNTKNKNTKKYEKELESILDVDKLIKYFAINTYLVNTDGYLNDISRNYAMYMTKEGRITIIPWDYNMIFGAYGIKDINEVINFDIYNPTLDCKVKDKPLLNVILGNKKYKKRYEKYLKDLTIMTTEGGTTSFNKKYDENNLATIINRYSNIIIKNDQKNSQRFYDSSEIRTAEENIKEVLKLRSKSVLSQIDKSGEIYSSSIDLRTMGGLDFLK